MKKIHILSTLLIGLMVFTACEDDRDSNPTVQQPASFVLNNPALAGNVYDLENTSNVRLTYKQPEYGYTAPVTYYAQVSLSDTWNEATSADADDATYIELDGSTSACEVMADASLVNRAIMKLGAYADAESVPSDISLFVRMRATLAAGYNCYSNVAELKVKPYFVPLTACEPEMWYLIGGCIGDGAWNSEVGVSLVPMSLKEGYKYNDVTGEGVITYTGYFIASQGFKLVKVPGKWDDQWGTSDGALTGVMNDGGSNNFFVPSDGYYTVELDTKEDKISVTAADAPKYTYDHLMISGDFNGWATDVMMTPVNTVAGMVNHIWTFDLDATSGDTTAKFLFDGWSPNWGATEFPHGFGLSGGPNIPVVAGHYTVIFNDVDGYYQFIAK